MLELQSQKFYCDSFFFSETELVFRIFLKPPSTLNILKLDWILNSEILRFSANILTDLKMVDFFSATNRRPTSRASV